MPRVFMSPIVSEISGRFADTTLGKNSKSTGGRQDFWPQIDRKGKPISYKGHIGVARFAFSYADVAYSAMPPEQRQEWREAIKAPNTTAYTLFMKECITSLCAYALPPVSPSESGGFSASYVIPGPSIGHKIDECLHNKNPFWLRQPVLASTSPIREGTWTMSLGGGALRYSSPDGHVFNWGEKPDHPKAACRVAPIGRPDLAVDTPALQPGGWSSKQEAAANTVWRPVQFEVPAGPLGIITAATKPDGWGLEGELLFNVGIGQPNRPKGMPWQS